LLILASCRIIQTQIIALDKEVADPLTSGIVRESGRIRQSFVELFLNLPLRGMLAAVVLLLLCGGALVAGYLKIQSYLAWRYHHQRKVAGVGAIRSQSDFSSDDNATSSTPYTSYPEVFAVETLKYILEPNNMVTFLIIVLQVYYHVCVSVVESVDALNLQHMPSSTGNWIGMDQALA
jgi:hypothetical protein